VLDPVPVAVPVTEATGEAAEVVGAAVEVLEAVLVLHPVLVVVPVTVEVTAPTAEVTEAEQELLGGVVDADACRENTSKMTSIPAATIATCTAR
jgi:hypothetical protein